MNLEEVIKIIEDEFTIGRVERIDSKELINRLMKKGVERNCIDDALVEAKRRKIIRIDHGIYNWIDPSLREVEKAKTQKYFQILAEIFKEGKIDFLPEEDVKVTLKGRGFNDEEIDRILIEAERDYVLDFYTRGFGPNFNLIAGCSWIPPEERQRHAEVKKARKDFSMKWHEEKAMQDEMQNE